MLGFWPVLFNVYGPRAEPDDSERIEFKLKFFKIMQVRKFVFLIALNAVEHYLMLYSLVFV